MGDSKRQVVFAAADVSFMKIQVSLACSTFK